MSCKNVKVKFEIKTFLAIFLLTMWQKVTCFPRCIVLSGQMTMIMIKHVQISNLNGMSLPCKIWSGFKNQVTSVDHKKQTTFGHFPVTKKLQLLVKDLIMIKIGHM